MSSRGVLVASFPEILCSLVLVHTINFMGCAVKPKRKEPGFGWFKLASDSLVSFGEVVTTK